MEKSKTTFLWVLLLSFALLGVGVGWYCTASNLKEVQCELQTQANLCDDLEERLASAKKKALTLERVIQDLEGEGKSETPFVSKAIVEELASCRAQLEAAEARNAELMGKLAKWEALAAQRAAMKARQQAERARQEADNAASLEAMRAQQAERQRNLEGKKEAERFQGYQGGYYFFSDGVTSKGWYARADLSMLGNEGANEVRKKIEQYESARREAYRKFGAQGSRKYEENDKILDRMLKELMIDPRKLRK